LQHRLLRHGATAAKPQVDGLRMSTAPLVPEVRLLLAEDPVLLWARLEAAAGAGLPAPFWATAWAGGQALARYVLDTPGLVAGRRVLDLASGSGLVAIAAARAGAVAVTANDIDPYAITAIRANARANGVSLRCDQRDLTGGDGGDADVVLAGDCLYNAGVAERFLPFAARAAARGATVLLGDPHRGHAPEALLETVATYDLPATGHEQGRRTSVLRPSPGRRLADPGYVVQG
jgi:predicted nicotinamide N-methyase